MPLLRVKNRLPSQLSQMAEEEQVEHPFMRDEQSTHCPPVSTYPDIHTHTPELTVKNSPASHVVQVPNIQSVQPKN